MPMLKVKCKVCGAMIPTGMDLSREQFLDLTYTDRSVECPVCEGLQSWGMQDVDMSVFGKPPPKSAG